MWLRRTRTLRDDARGRAREMTVFARALPAGSEVSMRSGTNGVVASMSSGSARLDVEWGGTRRAVVTLQGEGESLGSVSHVDLAQASDALLPEDGPDEEWLLAVARAWAKVQHGI
jgi:hypothetical protein